MQTDVTELVETMFRLARLIKDEMSYTHNVTHLSMLQIQTLIYIHKHTNASMSDIAQQFHIELPSATSLLNKLCEQHLVKRFEDEKDRRLVRVALTDEGKKLLEEAMRERRKKLEQIMSNLSKREQSQLLSIIHTLQTKLQHTV